MSLRRASLVLIAISALFVSAFTFFQSPEEKEAPDIAKIRDEWFYAPRRDPQGHARGDLRLKALQQKQQMRRNMQSVGIATSTPQHANATTAGAMTAASTASPAAVDLTSTPWQPIGPQ